MGIREKLENNYRKCMLLLEDTKMDQKWNHVRKICLKDLDTVRNYIEQTDDTDPDHVFCQIYESILLLLIGNMHVDSEEISEGINYFMQCLDSIKSPLNPTYVLPSLMVRNELGRAHCRLSNKEEALRYLTEAEDLYCAFQSLNPPVEAVWIMGSVGKKSIEEEHMTTQLFLAQVYGVLKYSPKTAVHCHKTLKTQLGQKKFDSIDWAMNVAKLSDFFASEMLFKQVRNHLAAASHILDKYEDSLKNLKGSKRDIEDKKEELRHRSADLAWCWAKYGLFLLQHSKYKLSNSEDEAVDEKHEELEGLLFDEFDLTRYENQITDTDVVTFEEAREVFLFSQRQFSKAKEYYTLEDWASKHAEIVRGHSSLFSKLSAFEPDEGRKFAMLKKRSTMLETVLKELNPRYYLGLCRQLWFELGEVYQDMMNIKYDKMENAPSAEAAKKVNSLIELSTKNFNHFLDSVKDKKTEKLPDPMDDNLIESALTALFYLGRLHFKYVTQDNRVIIEKTNKAQEYYKNFMDICDSNEKAKVLVGEKYELSKSLIPLLQLKALKLQFSTFL